MKIFMQIKGFSLWNFPRLGLNDDSALFTFPKQSQPFACTVIQFPLNHDDKEIKTEKEQN